VTLLSEDGRGYRIRRATIFDVRAVHRLEQAIFPLDAYPYFDLILLFFWPGIINLKVIAPDGSMAGFVSATRNFFRPRGWIITIGVSLSHRRRGFGRLMLATAEKRLHKPFVRLTVRASNVPAITLYRSMGYSVIERKVAYYRDGEAGLIMEKAIR